MAKQNVAEQETLGEAMNKTELFFERNGRTMSYVFLGLLVLAALVFGYRSLILQPRATKAAEMIAEAQNRFEGENPDFETALLGDDNAAGFLDVIEKYGSTPSGNLAKHYAGICYLRTGDLENAAKYLAKFSQLKGIPGELINAQNYGLQGDIAVEQQDYARAVKFYEKAVKAADKTKAPGRGRPCPVLLLCNQLCMGQPWEVGPRRWARTWIISPAMLTAISSGVRFLAHGIGPKK